MSEELIQLNEEAIKELVRVKEEKKLYELLEWLTQGELIRTYEAHRDIGAVTFFWKLQVNLCIKGWQYLRLQETNMNYFQKIITYINNPFKFLVFMLPDCIQKHIPDELYLRLQFRAKFGTRLNLKNPKSFNEKLQWLKLNNRRTEYVRMVDKYEVKQYIVSIIGDEYIIPTLGVWDKFEEIDFDSLPNQFVLKCTHDSGGLVIVKDKSKLDLDVARKKINRCLKSNYYWIGREWPYKNIKPRIIAEKYMENTTTAELRDYKFFCFNGVVKCYKVDFDRFSNHRANYFSTEGELLRIGEEICPPDPEKAIEIPENIEIMYRLAEMLSNGNPFLRADFYDVEGKVYFGELTFYPASGFGKFIYEGNDELLGSWLKLPLERLPNLW